MEGGRERSSKLKGESSKLKGKGKGWSWMGTPPSSRARERSDRDPGSRNQNNGFRLSLSSNASIGEDCRNDGKRDITKLIPPYLLFLDSGSRSLRTLARMTGRKDQW